jgi:hypothetical protein
MWVSSLVTGWELGSLKPLKKLRINMGDERSLSLSLCRIEGRVVSCPLAGAPVSKIENLYQSASAGVRDTLGQRFG